MDCYYANCVFVHSGEIYAYRDLDEFHNYQNPIVVTQ